MIDDAAIKLRYAALDPVLDERGRRRFAAAEAVAAGRGGKRCLEVVPETKTDSGDALWIGIFSLKRIGNVVDDIGDTDVEDAVARQGRTDSDEVTVNSVTRDPQQALGKRA